MHTDEVRVRLETARALVAESFPGLEHLPVPAEGTVHAVYRIGEDLTARFPLRRADPAAVLQHLYSEAAAAGELATCSPVPVPVPVGIGRPGHGYPLPWAVQTWVSGRTAAEDDPGWSPAFAADLAGLIRRLRSVDTRGRRFAGDGRGGHLPDHDAWMETCFRRSAGLLDVDPLRRMWATFRELPRADGDVMSHGDLVPGNVVTAGGRLTGLLDGGGFGPADPALDLVAAWHLLDDGPRAVLRDMLGCGVVEWERGRAWAFAQAMGLGWYYVESNQALSRLGLRTLERLSRAR
ncbi:phosphotransferase [Pseudonocardia sp. NPDC049635]|uniref:phosphotransferase n=1 Tax=Pseudonocardia sp. NPDC049635 TaxID=3155506 RepID=UPI00341098F8